MLTTKSATSTPKSVYVPIRWSLCDAEEKPTPGFAAALATLHAVRAEGGRVILSAPWLDDYRGNARLMRWATAHEVPYDELGHADAETTHILIGDKCVPTK